MKTRLVFFRIVRYQNFDFKLVLFLGCKKINLICFLIFTLLNCNFLHAQHFKVDPELPAYFLKKNELIISTIIREADFRKGNNIADIGAGDGLFDAAISIYTDSLTFFLEDIDSTAFLPGKFNRAIRFYSSIRKENITNNFIPCIGTEKGTNLQTGLYDKVLVIDTYHHFSFRDEMIEDLNRILKSGGELFIYDVIAKKSGDIHLICNTPIYLKKELISQVQSKGFSFIKMVKLKRMAKRKTGLYMFRKYP